MRRYLELYIEKAFSVSQFTPVAVLVPVPDSGFPLFRTPFLDCSCFRALVCLFDRVDVDTEFAPQVSL